MTDAKMGSKARDSVRVCGWLLSRKGPTFCFPPSIGIALLPAIATRLYVPAVFIGRLVVFEA